MERHACRCKTGEACSIWHAEPEENGKGRRFYMTNKTKAQKVVVEKPKDEKTEKKEEVKELDGKAVELPKWEEKDPATKFLARVIINKKPQPRPFIANLECHFFHIGKCKKGAACNWRHTEPKLGYCPKEECQLCQDIIDTMYESRECHFFHTSKCTKGKECDWMHTEPKLGYCPKERCPLCPIRVDKKAELSQLSSA